MSAKDVAIYQTPEQERETFSEHFPGVVPTPDGEGRIDAARQNRTASESHIRFLYRMMSVQNSLNAQGISPVTILNANPYQLKVNSVLVGDIVIPPRAKGRPYSVTVIRDVRFTHEEGVDGDRHPIPWVPLQLARDFEETYYANGGVLVYKGDGEKIDPAKTLSEDKALNRNFENCIGRQMAWAREQVRNADAFHRDKKGGNINDIHRACAALLHDVGRMSDLPEWMDKVPGQYGLGEQCPRCKSTPQANAYMCAHCTYILDPKAAFEQGDIDISDVSLLRLSRSVLEEMGISEHIAAGTTIEERNTHLRKEAEKMRKEKAKAAK